jgi:hypothetical protein
MRNAGSQIPGLHDTSNLSSRDSSVSAGRLEPSDAMQRFFFQLRRVARDGDLAAALDVRHTTVKRRDQLAQMTKSTRTIRFSADVLVGHRMRQTQATCSAETTARVVDATLLADGIITRQSGRIPLSDMEQCAAARLLTFVK